MQIINTITNPNPKRNEPGHIEAKAVLSPVADQTAPTTRKRVFTFGKGKSEGNKAMKSLLGGKGANLAEMASIGLSVPPGLTISTEACQEYQLNGKDLPQGLWEEILEGLESVQKDMGAILGDPAKPLLLSVRSGAAISMPGMMDTVLNLGLNDEVVAGLAAKSGERFAYDSYRRFLDMFGDVVMGIPHSSFEEQLEKLKGTKGVELDTKLTASDLKELVEQYKNDPKQQLLLAIKAVFDSWDSPRANKYRSINQITGLKGTAVNIQCMVFGNMGNTSGTGVLFTRNPSTGERKLYGEFLINAQLMRSCGDCEILEKHYKDMMDIEFTVQENRLWMLQCRAGKRTGKGAVKIAVDMVNEGLVDKRAAIKMFENPTAYKDKVIATGLPASPGAAVGTVVFSADDAEAWHAQGKSVILVRTETSPKMLGVMHAAAGILTARGGMTSHAAVCSSWVGANVVFLAALTSDPLSPPALSGDLETFMSWADKVRFMANADTPEDALTARNNVFSASDDRIKAVRKMIMAVTTEQRKATLNLLLPYQRSDFEEFSRQWMVLPVTIRLLDPPLHEFLPEGDLEQIVGELSAETGMTEDEVFSRIENLSEVNPMLGFRGCRLGISYPELTEMQTRAIFQAAELGHQVRLIHSVGVKVFSEMDTTLSYKVGTMIEIPRAALVADEVRLRRKLSFFSFGTNDLTQMTFGYSRDDGGKFLPIYLGERPSSKYLIKEVVGELIKMATEKGRASRPSLKVGICGEHGGEPSSVAFFAEVPIARLAAAQVAV
ncbi:phosphate dikinase [Pyrus ussuriensis x Pyrus communis]|uniref:pyruvate, phosphate dikinase n=1 Tax=Pyrus ussuriensis x Pyrus communis TaxID=2448454 RepID=A0A5N5HPT2_9ROSA|nr:phosphate dikinase [Pyrus ussuriensis x Pyrus communis]